MQRLSSNISDRFRRLQFHGRAFDFDDEALRYGIGYWVKRSKPCWVRKRIADNLIIVTNAVYLVVVQFAYCVAIGLVCTGTIAPVAGNALVASRPCARRPSLAVRKLVPAARHENVVADALDRCGWRSSRKSPFVKAEIMVISVAHPGRLQRALKGFKRIASV